MEVRNVEMGIFVPLERELVDERLEVWTLLLDEGSVCDVLFCEEVSSETAFEGVDCRGVLVSSGIYEDTSRLEVES